jgi:hypothetical protein
MMDADPAVETSPMPAPTCPLTGPQVVAEYFMEHRAKLLDIASFLDRLDRAGPPDGRDDVRVRALRKAIPLLLDGQADRARRILELLSDHTTEPIPEAHTQGALGADPRAAY